MTGTYSDGQINQYLDRIAFPSDQKIGTDTAALNCLVACHLQAVPFEDLALHYSKNPIIDLTPATLFDKVVTRRQGGYCMEQNLVFAAVLKSLGFELYTIGARVALPSGFTGWQHMGIIVTIDGTEYLVDVGFGGNGPTRPIPIFKDGKIISQPVPGVLPEEHRVVKGPLPGGNKRGYEVWHLQHRRNQQTDWRSIYAFDKDLEFLLPDYETMNLAISLDPAGLFPNVLICANVNYNGLDAISRKILVNDRFKKREKGETTEDVTFKNEQERIQKLKDQFGIELTPDEVEGIKGRRTAMEVFDPDTVPIDIFAAFS